VEDFFFIDKTTALLIEQKTKIIPQKDDLEGMLLTLENDFLIQSNAYIGNFNESSYDFTSFFAEEKQIFSDYYEEQRKVFSFQDVALDYLTKDKIGQSPIMTSLKEAFDLDQEIKEIIKTLWLNQGNITSTSKELYIHRNTLQYRLDKFYERYGLSLKEMKNLTLCYLLID
jgi:DNA-binding PucR family transcriptional regulator